MESMVSIVNLILSDVSSEKVLQGQIDYRHFSQSEFISLYNKKSDTMSGNDVKQLYLYLLTLLNSPQDRVRDLSDSIFSKDGFSVLELIKVYVNRVLEQIQSKPVCRYRRLLAWRMVTSKLEEDIFTTAFLAIQDIEKSRIKRTSFNWATVIGHNNYELNNLLKKGVVENHYHLKGSAPYFAIAWLNLMNDVGNQKFIAYLEQFEKHKLAKTVGHEKVISYVEMHLQAALIRAFLFARLAGKHFSIFYRYEMQICEIEHYLDWPKEEPISNIVYKEVLEHFKDRRQQKVDFREFVYTIITKTNCNSQTFWKALMTCVSQQHVFDIAYLEDKIKKNNMPLKEAVLLLLGNIKAIHVPAEYIEILLRQEYLDEFIKKEEFRSVCNYLTTPGIIYEIRYELQRFIEESYVCNCELRENDCIDKREVLHDYIKYILPQNDNGFINVNYTERWFLYTMFLKLYGEDAEIADCGNLFYAYLIIKEKIRAELVQVNNKTGFDNFLEYQNRKEYFIDNTIYEPIYSYIALADTWHYQKETLVGLEARISPKDTSEDNRKAIQRLQKALNKIEDGKNRTFFVFHFIKEPDLELVSGRQQCRHFRKREEVRKKAIAIERFRQNYPKEASLVYGIDACSPEIGCRPEVFAQAFTYLRGMQSVANLYAEEVPRLGISYHVGEDFLDIVDGLRAIDEAINFLHMDSGDRLGHALALGVNPREWYEFKGSRVLLTKQDHLDNIVWIYMKIRKYNIRHSESMLQKLYRDYIHCMKELYGDNAEYDINVYYDAWKLRGDNPEMYLNDHLESEESEWGYFSRNMCYPENEKIRGQELCRELYTRYHYDEVVKMRGAEVVECKIERELVEVIEQIQKQLQKEVARLGISIETNPSSNYMIGTFTRYDQHPIRNFYNKGLTVDNEDLMKIPQIDVTINTDDQAVFSTNLENEYAYIALSMEKLKKEDGEYVYKRSMIYEWLNNIRRTSKKVCFWQNERNLLYRDANEKESDNEWDDE